MTPLLAYISLALLIWSILGFWMASSNWVYVKTARWEPAKLWNALIWVLAGPIWWVLDIVWRIANRIRHHDD